MKAQAVLEWVAGRVVYSLTMFSYLLADALTGESIYGWLVDYRRHVAVAVCAFVGSVYASIWKQSAQNLTPAQRYVSQTISVFLVMLPLGYLVDSTSVSVWWLCSLGVVMGFGADSIAQWIFDFFRAGDFPEFFARLVRAVKSGLQAYNDVKKPPTNPPNDDVVR